MSVLKTKQFSRQANDWLQEITRTCNFLVLVYMVRNAFASNSSFVMVLPGNDRLRSTGASSPEKAGWASVLGSLFFPGEGVVFPVAADGCWGRPAPVRKTCKFTLRLNSRSFCFSSSPPFGKELITASGSLPINDFPVKSPMWLQHQSLILWTEKLQLVVFNR